MLGEMHQLLLLYLLMIVFLDQFYMIVLDLRLFKETFLSCFLLSISKGEIKIICICLYLPAAEWSSKCPPGDGE